MPRKKAYANLGSANRSLTGDFVLEDVHLYRVNRHTFTVYVGGDPLHTAIDANLNEPGVEYLMADRFEMNLSILSGIDPQRPILVHLASCGGDWYAGMQMFGAILTCPNPVTVLATRWARSMTSIIPLAADRFVMRPPARYMFHDGHAAMSGTVKESLTDADELRKSSEIMLRIYVARLKERGIHKAKTDEELATLLRDLMDRRSDVWFSADEAKRWGFADGVFDGNLVTLLATSSNQSRRKRMLAVLRQPVHVMSKTY
jgi:ATP-dependent protease ClpP protease subunit